jgi:hypothetical protein
MTPSQQYHQLRQEGCTRFNHLLPLVQVNNLENKLGTSPNSFGYLMQQVAEAALLFSENPFSNREVQIVAKTIIEGKYSGVWTDLDAIKAIIAKAEQTLSTTILQQTPKSCKNSITTKAEALDRMVTHTAYHAGQIAWAIKYRTF